MADGRKRGPFANQENWEMDTRRKKVKVDQNNAPKLSNEQQQKAKVGRSSPLTENYQQNQHEFANLQDDKELELKGLSSEF